MTYTAHPSAIVDDGATIGEGSRIWHFVHVCGGAKIGKDVSLGQNVFVGNQVLIGDNCKRFKTMSPFMTMSFWKKVFFVGRVGGVYQCFQLPVH